MSDAAKEKMGKRPMPAPKPAPKPVRSVPGATKDTCRELSGAPEAPGKTPLQERKFDGGGGGGHGEETVGSRKQPEEYLYEEALSVQSDILVKAGSAKYNLETPSVYEDAMCVKTDKIMNTPVKAKMDDQCEYAVPFKMNVGAKNCATESNAEYLYDEAMPVQGKNSCNGLENCLYADPIAVTSYLLPSEEIYTASATDLQPESVYNDALAVCPSKDTGEPPSCSKKLPQRPKENVYEMADTVSVAKLPSNEVNGTFECSHPSPNEPVYSDAETVVTKKRLQLEERNANKKGSFADNVYAEIAEVNTNKVVKAAAKESVYAEAAEVNKSLAGDSSDEEEPMYFKLFMLQNSQGNIKKWKSRANPDLENLRMEENTRKLSIIRAESVNQPMKAFTYLPVLPTAKDKWPGLMSKQQSMDEEWSDDLPPLQSFGESDKIKMRKFVVTNLLDSEKAYCDMLQRLGSFMHTLKSAVDTNHEMIPLKEIEAIFNGISSLTAIHEDFVKSLKPVVDKWSKDQQVGTIIKDLGFKEYGIAETYLKKHQIAVNTVQKCRNEFPKFAEYSKTWKCGNMETNLEELLRKPIERFQRFALVLHDLISCTPTSHPDYDLLQKTLKLAQNFLSESNVEDTRYLVKYGIVVEKPGKGRKLRQLFLFNDILVCSKQKISGRQRVNEVKWFMLLSDLILDDKFSAQEEKQESVLHQQEIDDLKKDVVKLQTELKAEIKRAKTSEGQTSAGNRKIENIRKKLVEKEACLLLTLPHLQLRLSNRVLNKTYILLMASDYERTNWKSTITGLTGKVGSHMQGKLSLADISNLINSPKIPKILGSALDSNDISLEEEYLNGILNVTIHKLQGLKESADTFCCIEVDSFGHFFMKAKTNRISKSMEPKWEEDFDIDLEGAHSLHILCYKLGQTTDSLIGKCSLALQKEWILEDFCEKTISLSNELLLTVSLKYTSPEQIKRMPAASKSGVFGVRLDKLTKKEGKPVPFIVTTCVEEIETRGLKDIGLYRVSGRSSEIERLKKAFIKSNSYGASVAKEADTNVLTSLLKLFFRDLPEALFTDSGYPEFIKGIGLSDPDAKQKFLVGQLSSLPRCNYATIIYLLEHVVRVSRLEDENKMSLQNLATVFGPTLLRPVEIDETSTAVETLFCRGANEAALQSIILLYFLNLKAKNFSFPQKSGK